MPKKKKAQDMTTEEIAKRVFPKQAIEQIKKELKESEKPKKRKS